MKKIIFFSLFFAITYSSPVAQPQRVALHSENKNNVMPVLQGDGSIAFIEVKNSTTTLEATLSDVTYYLYTQSNRDHPYIITNGDISEIKLSPFSSKKLSVFITHGWRNYYKSDVNTEITSAILDNYDINVFVVDWSGPANSLYLIAKTAVPQVGKHEGEFIKNIKSTYDLSGDDFILIGHSLGAHVAGCAGAELDGNVNTVIGLDPAGPLYSHDDTDVRIDPTDGKFVHIIHTDGGFLGYFDPTGHADYYPNGGKIQPGCELDLTGICGHSRSYEYFTESIRSKNAFSSRACGSYNMYENQVCKNTEASPMGGVYVDKTAKGTFYLETYSRSPYGKH